MVVLCLTTSTCIQKATWKCSYVLHRCIITSTLLEMETKHGVWLPMRWSSKRNTTAQSPPSLWNAFVSEQLYAPDDSYSINSSSINNNKNNWCCGISGHLQSQHSGHNQHWLLPRDGHRQHQQERYQVHGFLQRYCPDHWRCTLTGFLKHVFPCTLCTIYTGILDLKQLKSQIYRRGNNRHGDNSGSVLASQSKGWRFESQQEQQDNFLLQGQLTMLTLILVSIPPPRYRSSM